MSQHDYNIANGGGAAVRSDINNALGAIQSQNSGSSAPTATKPRMPWYDTATGAMKFRDTGDTAWESAVHAMVGAGGMSFRNRIINGDMRIDQRNAGASVTLSSDLYIVDRFTCRAMTALTSTAQQSSTAPSGFNKSLLFTVGTGAAPAAGDRNTIVQNIEGFNVADLLWGTASAQTITVSFWVRSSLTGTFSGAVSNSALNRSYPFTFTINSANTFEFKTVTIPGDTTGTWTADNTAGLRLWFDMGSGSTYQGTAGAWAGADYRAATGATKLVSTTGATFYITGVQLEAGPVATPFERRAYGAELALCQRYFAKIYGVNTVYVATKYTTNKLFTTFTLPVTPRATPSASIPSGAYYAADYNIANFDSNPTISSVEATEFGSNVNVIWNISWNPASSVLCRIGANTATNLWFSMEL